MFGRNKFKKLKREDVVNAIIDQTKQQEDLENGILQKSEEVERLLERGRKEKNRDVKLLCAKKGKHLARGNQARHQARGVPFIQHQTSRTA